MEDRKHLLFTEERIAKNPAIDLKVVNEAQRARQELEALGIWEEDGSRVRSPFEIRPGLKPHTQRITQIIAQG